jgi:hypothetical protein
MGSKLEVATVEVAIVEIASVGLMGSQCRVASVG